MSNIMSMKHLRNNVSRNAFDLSMRKAFTAKVGEILPVFCKEVLPGDKFDLKVNAFTRTQPVNSAAYTRIKEYYDYFFVPYRLLWRYFDQFVTQTSGSNPQFAANIARPQLSNGSQHPVFRVGDVLDYLNALYKVTTSSTKLEKGAYNQFSFYRHELTFKLLQYLGYGGIFVKSGSDDPNNYYKATISRSFLINAFPVLAYQKVYADFFRNEQWESNAPETYNVDYALTDTVIPVQDLFGASVGNPTIGKKANMFDMRYCCWNKDLFMGLLPSPQFGDSAIIGNSGLPDILNFSSGEFGVDSREVFTADDVEMPGFRIDSNSGYAYASGINSTRDVYTQKFDSGRLVLTNGQLSSISVLALRQAEALQKWKEISISGKQDYKDQIEKHFGISVPNSRSNLCEWIGGTSDVLDISEVVNTNLQGLNDSDTSVSADIAGKGVGLTSGSDKFEAKEHGLLMCIYHAVPLLDYGTNVVEPFILKNSVYDYAIPEFDKIGMQPVPALCLGLIGSSVESPGVSTVEQFAYRYNAIGYAPRYIDYKTSVDSVCGAFSDTLRYWCAPVDSKYISNYVVGSMAAVSSDVSSLVKLLPSFFQVNPHILDSIFAVNADGSYNTDTFLINSFHDIKVVRNLDRDGLPY